MIIMYVVLDGYDLGTGILHLFIARDDEERRINLSAIGPFWDGNEVWLITAGGTLFFAFPKLYASSFSGFYLPMILILWLLIGRALGIELRKHLNNELWKSFWDVVFSLSSLLLVIIFGAALGNIIRGVPINSEGYFFEPLWTTFSISTNTGILDWFTVLMSLIAISAVSVHGANYIALKTEGNIHFRARKYSKIISPVVLVLSIIALVAVSNIKPEIWNNYSTKIWGYIFPVIGYGVIIGMIYYRVYSNDKNAFISSSLFIAGMLATTAFGLFPNLLTSTIDPKNNLTVYNSITGIYSMNVAATWWIGGMILVIIYFIFIIYKFKGKVSSEEKEY
jgi:cytochrome d ubiquinol oxidase subunit II